MATTHFYYTPGSDASCLTLVQAKKQLGLETSFVINDDLIQECIDSSQVECENYINRAISRRKFVLELNNFDDILFQMNYDNDAIDKIEYYAEGEITLTVLDPTKYKLRNSTSTGCLEIKFLTELELPVLAVRTDAVIVTISQGWETAKVPTPIKQAMKLYISDYYERREDRGEVGYNTRAQSLLRPYRKYN